ncbi:MAG: polymer-forming cytoskeletal protein [Lachnospiraceae bacterium]|nr:polymer-forming cytoskeletal protein [Lachnospiraceae bacterium]
MRKKNTDVGKTQTVGTLIGAGAVFDGNINAPETIRIDGSLNGDCTCKENVILGTEGVIIGNISALNVTLSGRVTGDIHVQGRLELFSTAKVTGNVTARSLIVDEDACFDGKCTMTTVQTDPSSKPFDRKKAKTAEQETASTAE